VPPMSAEIVTVNALSGGVGFVHCTFTKSVMSALVVMFRNPDQVHWPYVLVLATTIAGWPLSTLVALAETIAGVWVFEIAVVGKYEVLMVSIHPFLISFLGSWFGEQIRRALSSVAASVHVFVLLVSGAWVPAVAGSASASCRERSRDAHSASRERDLPVVRDDVVVTAE
jgi:hypothetical protein